MLDCTPHLIRTSFLNALEFVLGFFSFPQHALWEAMAWDVFARRLAAFKLALALQ